LFYARVFLLSYHSNRTESSQFPVAAQYFLLGSLFFFLPICEQAPEGADLKEGADQTRSGQPDRRFSRAIRVEPGALRGMPDG
jgi:hypothetical protein